MGRKRRNRPIKTEVQEEEEVIIVDAPGPSSGKRVVTNDNNYGAGPDFREQFESAFGYVKNCPNVGKRRRLEIIEKDSATCFNHHESNEASFNQNWSNGRYGVSQEVADDSGHDVESEEVSGTFPNELVAYLRSILTPLENADSKTSVLIKKKCLDECKNSEVLLLSFESSARVVEKVFEGYQPAAKNFHTAVLNLSKNLVVDALLFGSSCRTLESLLYALSTSKDYMVFERWTEVVIEAWDELIFDKNGSHFVRSLVRTIIGLPKKKVNNESTIPEDLDFRKKIVKAFNVNLSMKKCFRLLADAALDFPTMKDKVNTETVSMIMQEMVEYDFLLKNGRRLSFLLKCLEEQRNVLLQWKGKFGSHFWQIFVKRIDEDARQMLFHAVINNNLSELAQHPYANFVVDSFVGAAISQELVTDIFDELLDAIPDICESGKWSVISGLIQTCVNHENKQKTLVKRLRCCFNCTKKSERKIFVPKVFSMMLGKIEIEADGKVAFDVRFGDYHGSVLLQELVKLKHNQSVVDSLLNLSNKTIFNLALDDKGTYLLQAFLNSPTVPLEKKVKLGSVLKTYWPELVDNNNGSYVFKALWDTEAFTLKMKRRIMTELCHERSEEKSGRRRLIAKKLDVRGFREDCRKWLRAEELRLQSIKKTT